MKTNVQALASGLLAALLALVLLGPQTAHAQGYTETTLHSFTGMRATADGASPYAGLVMDRAGNLFGTTYDGGAAGQGTVFEITAGGAYFTRHSFTGVNGDGWHPQAGVILDRRGDLFGTAQLGGTGGQGVVFEIAAGTNAYSTLHAFTGAVRAGTYANADGASLQGGLVLDSRGDLFGTTDMGGTSGQGTVFEITPGGAYSTDRAYSTLHSFTGNFSFGGDGAVPQGSLVLDSRGSLFGATSCGGPFGHGIVFALVKDGVAYAYWTLHTFNGTSAEGMEPQASLVMDGGGNLYGTTDGGGMAGEGTVFEITPGGVFSTLYSFSAPQRGTFINADGVGPRAALLLDGRGNLFGTAQIGGLGGQGTVFEITPGEG